MFLIPGVVRVGERNEVGTCSFGERESQPARPFQVLEKLIDRPLVGIPWAVEVFRNFSDGIENV